MDEVELFIKALNELYFDYGCKLGSAANNVVRIDYTAPRGFTPPNEILLIVWDNETQQYVRGK